MARMLFGWSTRNTALSAVFTKRCPLPGSGFASLNTPLAAHAYMMRSMYFASLPTLAAISAADSGPSKLAKPEPGKGHRFVNTALSAVLLVDHPNSMRAMVGHQAEDAYPAWGKLVEFLEDPKGPIAWDMAFPKYPFDKGGIWNYYEAKPEQEDQFGRAMTAIDGLGAQAMVDDGPFERFSRVVDIGGGRGHMMHVILDALPTLRGVVMDRAPVIELAKKA